MTTRQRTGAGSFAEAAPDGAGARAVRASGLPELLSEIDPGRFGTTTRNVALLETVAAGLDLIVTAHEKIAYALSEPSGEAVSLEPLTGEQKRLAGYFAILVFCRGAIRGLGRLAEPHEVEGELSSDGLAELAEMEPDEMAERLASLMARFLHRERQSPKAGPLDSDEASARCACVFATLLERAVRSATRRGRIGKLRELVADTTLEVAGETWRGLTPRSIAPRAEGALLRPVSPEDVVGNSDYVEAGLRLARDVAGYDLEARRNPKSINPVLFALGRPGCGKTLAAHAIGNSFMSYCAERSVPARFVIIRRTDWASSYQNASAANLVKIFRDAHAFEGVCGIYWADIDTALASRDQAGLRAEEKANLSAAFNVFDGTLIPFDGKWFMLCDANNLAMDEALKSRIAKNPFKVVGPETGEDYVRLLRDILLRDFSPFLEVDEQEWRGIGERALGASISGRGMQGISRQIIDRIQDFEYPDGYYSASFEERQRIIERMSNPVDGAFLASVIDRYVRFEKDEEERMARRRFDDAVTEAVFGLNVQREVFQRAGEE